MLLNDDQILGIKHGIEEGFNKGGIILSDREKLVLDLSVKTTLDLINHIYGYGK